MSIVADAARAARWCRDKGFQVERAGCRWRIEWMPFITISDEMLIEITNQHEFVTKAVSASQVTKWQPIETAPKDGTHILLRYWKTGNGFRTRRSKVWVVTEGFFMPDFDLPPSDIHPNGYTYVRGWWVDALERLIQDTNAKKSKSIVVQWRPMFDDPEEE